MRASQVGLRILCVVLLVYGLSLLIFGAVMAFGVFIPGADTGNINIGGAELTSSQGAALISTFFLAAGICDLILGVVGLIGASKPSRIMPFFILCIIGFILYLLYFIVCLLVSADWSYAAMELAFVFCCLILSATIRSIAREQRNSNVSA